MTDDDDRRRFDERILVLAPLGRDARVTRDVLARASLSAEVCADMAATCAKLSDGAGALVLAEEALTTQAQALLGDALRAQPPWSDVPILVLTGTGETTETRVRAIAALDPSGNVTILERPVRVFTLVVTVQAMLRARRRQYQMRDLHLQMQVQMDRLQQERELRARFVSALAHDLRGPVSAAMLAAEMISRRPERLQTWPEHRKPDPLQARGDLAGLMKRNLERIDQMVRDLLDASRIQAGRPLQMRFEPAELRSLLADVVEDLATIHTHQVRLDAPAEVRGVFSVNDLRRAVWNLVTNAVKYGSPGAPVTVRLTGHEGRAQIAVHNHGNPIAPEDVGRIFEPFARANSAELLSAVGWGLGLTLVRGFAETHGGQVSVDSDPERGTTFTIDIPCDVRVLIGGGGAKDAPPGDLPPVESS